MKLIDADLLKKEMKIYCPEVALANVNTTIDAQPFLEMVKCKDCKYITNESIGDRYLCNKGMYVSKEGCCSYGERKEENEIN